MPNGLMIVESSPASPEQLDAFNAWYDEQHIPEILKVPGFVSARRLKSANADSFIAVYEIEGELADAQAALREAQLSGAMSAPSGVQLNPPPSVRYFENFAS
jgi:hypothetical protein